MLSAVGCCGVMDGVGAGDQAADSRIATEPRSGLVRDVADELRWTFKGRKLWLLGIACNLTLAAAYVGYTHYNPRLHDDIRFANFGLLIVVWVLADVVNTNQLGSDCDRVAASLDRGDSVPRILAIKNLALAVLLIPLALAISLGLRVIVNRWTMLAHALMTDVGAVFLWLGVGAIASVLLPYRPIQLRARWKARNTWLRWAICLAAPYAAVFLLVPLLHLPYAALYYYRGLGPYLPHYLAYSGVYLAIGGAYWGLGLLISASYARSHRSRLVADLRRAG